MSSANQKLNDAKKAKNDEFYTQAADVHAELKRYKKHFSGKTVYCNCDDYRMSKFYGWFFHFFTKLGLKRLIATGYSKGGRGMLADYNGVNLATGELQGNGDFRSDECISLLKQSDIVVTNPPFSLFREYVAQLVEYGKKFIIIGNKNAVTYKEIFPLIKDNKIWLGVSSGARTYIKPDGTEQKLGDTCWFTNLEHGAYMLPLPLMTMADNLRYSKHKEIRGKKHYDRYDNYDAIEVPFTDAIPSDYPGVMGVPISWLDKYCPEQFEIVGIDRYVDDNPNYGKRFTIDGSEIYARILIRRRK
jgi:hypothetical protein